MADDDFFVGGAEGEDASGGDANLDEFFQPSQGDEATVTPANPPDLTGAGSSLPVDPSAPLPPPGPPAGQMDMEIEPLAADPMDGGGFEVPEESFADDGGSGGKKKLIIIIVAIVAGVALLGSGGYYAYSTFLAEPEMDEYAINSKKPMKKAPRKAPEKVSQDAPKDANGKSASDGQKKKSPTKAKKKKPARKAAAVPVRRPRKGTYAVQVGAYAVKSNVNAPASKLRRDGLDPYIVEKRQHVNLYEVIVGSPDNKDEAKALAGRLKKIGYRPSIKRGKSGEYVVIAVTHPKSSLASRSVTLMKDEGLSNVRIAKRSGTRILNQLRVGEYSSAAAANKTLARVKSNGFAAVRVRN